MTQVKSNPAKAAEQTNGKGNGLTNGNATSATPSADVTKEVQQLKELAKESIEAKIARIQDLADTVERLEALRECQKDLKSFKVGAGNVNSQLTLRDGNGKEFRTSNTDAIAALVEHLKDTFAKMIKEAEAQLVL